jgi:hypothetical protein
LLNTIKDNVEYVVLKNIAKSLDKKKYEDFLFNVNFFQKTPLKTANKKLISFISDYYLSVNNEKLEKLYKNLLNNCPVIVIQTIDEKSTLNQVKNIISKVSIMEYLNNIVTSKKDEYKTNHQIKEQIDTLHKKLLLGDAVITQKYINTKLPNSKIENININNFSDENWKSLKSGLEKENDAFYVIHSTKNLSTGAKGNFIYIIPAINNNILNFAGHDFVTHHFSSIKSINKQIRNEDKKILLELMITKSVQEFVLSGLSNIPMIKNNNKFNISKDFMKIEVFIKKEDTKEKTDNLLNIDFANIMKSFQTRPFVQFIYTEYAKIQTSSAPALGGVSRDPSLMAPSENENDNSDLFNQGGFGENDLD